MLFLHVDIHVAVAASLVSVIACSCASAAPFVTLEVIGIGVFVGLPVARVALMLGLFARRREWRFALLAALVLAIIAAGAAIGLVFELD